MIVLTTLLTSTPDPQRGTTWECDPVLVEQLARSVVRHGHDLVVLHDAEPMSRPEHGRWVRVEREHPNPYFDRWRIYASVLADWWATSAWDGVVWCVDATDVELLRPPPALLNVGELLLPRLYCGSETDAIGWQWLFDNHPTAAGMRHIEGPLYNAGLLGGDLRAVRSAARSIARLANAADLTDMAAFNWVMRAWHGDVVTGDSVHTRFRANEREHPTATWRHK